MKLVSTKRTAAQRKAEKEKYDKPSNTIGGEDYPYGSRLSLDKHLLETLGISPKDFKVGQKVCLEAEAMVKSLRTTEGKDYDSNEIELTLTKIGLEKKADSTLKDAVSKGIDGASSDE